MTPKPARAESFVQVLEAGTELQVDLHSTRMVEVRRPPMKPSDRRVYRRLTAREFEWLRAARLKYGLKIRILDISAGGMSIETDHALKPQSQIVVELTGTGSGLVVPSLVLRSQIARLGDAVCYRSACSFKRPLQLARLIPRVDRFSDEATDFIRLDLALKNLLRRYAELARSSRPAAGQQRIGAEEIIGALEALVVKAASLRTDPSAHRLADVIAGILPVLKRREPAAAVLQQIQCELRRTVPQLEAELSDAPLPSRNPGASSICFDIANDPSGARVLNVEYPEGFVPDEFQLRVLQGGRYLVELLQGWNDLVIDAQADPAPREPLPPSAAPSVTSSKVIARFHDGRMLKGYTTDFSAMRPRLRLSEKPSSGEAALVQLADLKALFFVRDFAGDRTYVEQKDFVTPPQGRKIEVTFADGEVLRGSTLSYHIEGYGFFVHPADSGGNNLRVFVSSASVRKVRFL